MFEREHEWGRGRDVGGGGGGGDRGSVGDSLLTAQNLMWGLNSGTMRS